jgi:hypothetical protein
MGQPSPTPSIIVLAGTFAFSKIKQFFCGYRYLPQLVQIGRSL